MGKNCILLPVFFKQSSSDIHAVKNEWKNSNYPMVPGHEIVGIVERVGDQVTKVKQGDHVGVGFMVNSCGQCNQCKYLSTLFDEIDSSISIGKENLEQHCTKGCAGTFNSTEMDRKTTTYGGMKLVNDNITVKFLIVIVLYSLKLISP
jgi:uncharacterized zinc-type alcohol dehydrogenase-like protein